MKGKKDRVSFWKRLRRDLKVNYVLYIMLIPVILYYVLFSYVPMAGVQLAFKEYYVKKGIWESPWVGLDNFKRFLSSYNFTSLIMNTLGISIYCLIVGTIVPIVFSLLLNYVKKRWWKKTLQMVTYLPYFISTLVMVGMLNIFLGDNGVLNVFLQKLGIGSIAFLSSGDMFRGVFAWSGAWQGMGFSSVIYVAALSGVDVQIHEAAIVDGASIWRRIWHIDLMELRPTIFLSLIMGLGGVLNVGYEKVLLMQNSLNISTSEVMSTYVYKVGLINSDYGFSTAVGLFNSLISMVLIIVANRVAKKTVGYSMW